MLALGALPGRRLRRGLSRRRDLWLRVGASATPVALVCVAAVSAHEPDRLRLAVFCLALAALVGAAAVLALSDPDGDWREGSDDPSPWAPDFEAEYRLWFPERTPVRPGSRT